MSNARIKVSHCQKNVKGEDRFSAYLEDIDDIPYYVLTVCDGHGGSKAAEVAVNSIPRTFIKAIKSGLDVIRS